MRFKFINFVIIKPQLIFVKLFFDGSRFKHILFNINVDLACINLFNETVVANLIK